VAILNVEVESIVLTFCTTPYLSKTWNFSSRYFLNGKQNLDDCLKYSLFNYYN
jgi:hypothetical protein